MTHPLQRKKKAKELRFLTSGASVKATYGALVKRVILIQRRLVSK